ncbi:hypothetical protein CSUI_007875, partial [Cystoisospora suis]
RVSYSSMTARGTYSFADELQIPRGNMKLLNSGISPPPFDRKRQASWISHMKVY